ncbi:hypothetical protein HIM_06120 [Hirsutella minnesotensis 3608]|uniref:Conserved oligomeric Golgi complex subunit 2 n=1 Tax=Hirsutella minnesotensis 3608 TaxID=1043627 RepID=A0A0F8A512_9HYPO|nr:hypothetical protein HIM_06120 [Hirsutella minnesotensis 3608]
MADFTRRPSAVPSGYNIPSSDSSEAGDDAPLPFPEALPRTDFLAPDFQPAAYLSALPHRHQTLEDLRSDLRDRSTAISAELLELVNSNYTAFLSLGSELRGGNDKVQDVKVALLGFRRAVEEIKAKVTARREETQSLNNQLRDVRSSISTGREMLELSDRLSVLEERLAIHGPNDSGEQDWDSDESDDDVDEDPDEHVEGLHGSSPARLLTSAGECRNIAIMADNLDQQHPYVVKCQARLAKCRKTLLLDLSNALKEARHAGERGQSRVLRYLKIYDILEVRQDAIKLLRKG